MNTLKILCAAAVATVGLAATQTAAAGDGRAVSITAASSNGLGSASGVPQQARNSGNNNEFIGCSVLRGAVITPEGATGPSLPGPNQLMKCSARSGGRAAACSTTDPEVVNLMASALASVTADSRLSFFFDASGTCTHLEVGLYSQLLKAQ